MASRFVRKVRTASGAVAVQVVTKVRGEVVEVEHVGSAHTDGDLALLLQAARRRLQAGQGELDLGPLAEAKVSTADVADWTPPTRWGASVPVPGREGAATWSPATRRRRGTCGCDRLADAVERAVGGL